MTEHYIDQTARDLARQALAEIKSHAIECAVMRRSQEQWQASATRILEDFKLGIRIHQDKIDDKMDGMNSFVVKLLISVCGASFGIIGVLLWKYVIV